MEPHEHVQCSQEFHEIKLVVKIDEENIRIHPKYKDAIQSLYENSIYINGDDE